MYEEPWITANRDLAEIVFTQPILGRLDAISDRLRQHGYSIKLDVGKKSTRATVKRTGFSARTSYRSLEGFMAFEEARLSKMDALAAHDGGQSDV